MDLLTTPAWKWQAALSANEITSVALIEACLSQIERLNHQSLGLNAMITVAPLASLITQAQTLDNERRSGLVRSPLHGIPIVIKDIFNTAPALAMPTTCGAAALAPAVGRDNCRLVDRLLGAGMIILGKTNLTEFCGLRASGMRMGLSSLGGQTQSPYIRDGLDEQDTPLGHTHAGGSSSGSAVAVAAGFAPISIGSETCGSLVVPANRAGLYSLKITNERAAGMLRAGMHRLSLSFDSVGAMARSARDLEDIIRILVPGLEAVCMPPCLPSTAFKGFRLGFVNPDAWRYSNELCFTALDVRERLVSCRIHPLPLDGQWVLTLWMKGA